MTPAEPSRGVRGWVLVGVRSGRGNARDGRQRQGWAERQDPRRQDSQRGTQLRDTLGDTFDEHRFTGAAMSDTAMVDAALAALQIAADG